MPKRSKRISASTRRPRDSSVCANASKRQKSTENYFQPLQTRDDKRDSDDEIEDAEPEISLPKNMPPITALKTSTDTLFGIMKDHKIDKFSVRKISIGHKIFCENMADCEKLLAELKSRKLEHFSYTPKHSRPLKAILSGLDRMDPAKLKEGLNQLGLQCVDVKLIHRSSELSREIILYLVYFKKGTTSVKLLREHFSNLNHVRVKWDYQSKKANRITQCYNCQMFGHGSSNCNVKTFCSICAGPHATANCDATSVKCVNCGGPHKSTDINCPNRAKYSELRNRYSRNTSRNRSPYQPNLQVNSNQIFCDSSHSNNRASGFHSTYANAVRYGTNNNANNISLELSSNDLFSLNELKALTLELIENLRNCKSKTEQFNVITNLAFKFLK